MEFVGYHLVVTSPVAHINALYSRIDKHMYKPATIANWVVLIYERLGRCRREVANKMVGDLITGCEAVGTAIPNQLKCRQPY